MHGEVAQVKVWIAHGRVLPVDDADQLAVVEKVGQKQIVVAGAAWARDCLHRLVNGRGLVSHPVDPCGERSRCTADLQVLQHRLERGEDSREGRAAVETPQRCGHPPQHWGLSDLVRRHPPSRNEPGDQHAFRLQKLHDLRRHAAPAGRQRARVLPVAIDPEELAVLPRDPDDERLSAHVHPVVEVGNPAAQL